MSKSGDVASEQQFRALKNGDEVSEDVLKHKSKPRDDLGDEDWIRLGKPKNTDELLSSLKKKLNLEGDLWKKFERDFGGNVDALRKFEKNPQLIDSWKVLNDGDLAKNIDALETIDFYKKNINGNTDELAESFKLAANKEDWISSKIVEIRSKARSLPGTSKGNGININGKWMRGTDANIGLFPKRIADKLKGRQFKNFKEVRTEFWKTVADDPELFNQFGRSSKSEMLKGNSPFALKTQQVGGRIKYELHHKIPIHDGGGVYDIDNLIIVSPRYHKEILDPAYHFKR